MPDEYTITDYINSSAYENYYRKSKNTEDIEAELADMAYEDSLFKEG